MSKTDLIQNEVKDAEAKEEVEVVEKKAPFAGTEYPDKRKPFVKQHNVIIVRKTANFKTLVVQTKNLLKNQFDSVELHGVDDESFLTVSLVAQCLLKYKYVTLTRLKTKTHQTILKRDDAKNGKDEDPDNRVILQPKLVVHLSKTVDFDSIYDNFESAFKKMKEEHAEDIQEIEKSAIKAVAEAEEVEVDA